MFFFESQLHHADQEEHDLSPPSPSWNIVFFRGMEMGHFQVLVSVSRVERMKGFEFYRFQFATGIFQTKLLVSIDGLWMSLVEFFVSLLLNWLNRNSETHLPVHLLSFSDTSRTEPFNGYQPFSTTTRLLIYSEKGPTKRLWAATYFLNQVISLVFPEILQSTQPDWEA